MNYDELTHDEAANRLREHDEADWSGRDGNQVIEPRDVLYWLDAFGDLDLAINCQGLPKDLPVKVVRKIDEYDVFNDWTGMIDESSCAMCGRDFYEFDWKHDTVIVDEYGDRHAHVELISDPAGFYWNAAGDEHLMCEACREPPNFSRMQPETTRREVRIFYGESGNFSRFTHDGGVIRWDFEWDMDYDRSTDLYNFTTRGEDELIRGHEIAASFAKGRSSRDDMMEALDFERINVKEIEQPVKGIRKFWRYAEEVLTGWATLDSESMTNEPTHPDLPFTYIIEGKTQAWVPSGCMEKFKAELVWQTLREAGDYERAEEHREEYDDLLSFDWQSA